MKGNNDTWMKFAEVNEGKHSFLSWKCFLAVISPLWLLPWSQEADASFRSVPVAASLCALAVCGVSSFPEEALLSGTPVSHTNRCPAFWASSPAGSAPPQSTSGTCSEHSSWVQFSANYLNFWNFSYLERGCVWVGNTTFEDTINLPKSWLLLWLQCKDIWYKNINKTVSDLKTVNESPH